MLLIEQAGGAARHRRRGKAGDRKGHAKGRIAEQVVGNDGGKDVGEDAESAAQDHLRVVGRREGEPKTWIHSDRLQVMKGLVQSGGDHAVVGCRLVSGDIVIAGGEPSEAIGLAYGIGIVFQANPGGHLEAAE